MHFLISVNSMQIFLEMLGKEAANGEKALFFKMNFMDHGDNAS